MADQRTDTVEHAFALVEGCSALVGLAGGLAKTGRAVDLSGLDQEIGRACAALLDLPAEQAAAARQRLHGLLCAIDGLVGHLTAARPPQQPVRDAG